MYGSHFWIVTLRPRSTSRRPSDAAAMPLPRELTTPPVTKMYFVELTDSPPSVAASAPLRRTGDPPRCPRPGRRTPPTAPRRSAGRAATAAAARGAPSALPGPAGAAPPPPAPRRGRRAQRHAGGRPDGKRAWWGKG